MVKNKEWTDEEIRRLRELYPSEMIFDEIVENFPHRTGNAIRLKASRLGIKRPCFMDIFCFKPIKFRENGRTNSKGYLIKCNKCSSWMKVGDNSKKSTNYFRCEKCGSFAHLLARA
jgi:hypothetical protein